MYTLSAAHITDSYNNSMLAFRNKLINSTCFKKFKILTEICRKTYVYFIEPRETLDDDLRRREFVTNVVLIGLALFFILRVIFAIVYVEHIGIDQDDIALVANTGMVMALLWFWRWSRKGHAEAASIGLLTLLALEALSLTIEWSFEFPVALLMYALLIICISTLLTLKRALVAASILSISIIIVGYLQVVGSFHPNTTWLHNDFSIGDMIGYVAILFVLLLISLSITFETKKSLRRALKSEATLAEERDALELRVAERNSEIEAIQLARNFELQRFAEFGRISATMLHEIANPITALGINLESCSTADVTIKQAKHNLRQIERYLLAARNQIKHQSSFKTFCVKSELHRVQQVMKPLAQKNGINLEVFCGSNYVLSGDPVKFSQIVSNIIVNAVDAYHNSSAKQMKKRIVVEANNQESKLVIKITDWGVGICPSIIEHIFDPFFSTKSATKRGLGIGLALVKSMIENDYNGTIAVKSMPSEGTVFSAVFPLQNA